jgi:fumarate reductase flavoprotein subunit
LSCHSEGGDAVSLGFVSHSRHYALEEFAEGGHCWSCHRLDETSRFGLLGTDGGIDTTTELSRDEVERLSSYFVSWASSEFLDHRHGQAGQRCLHCHGNDLPVEPVAMDVCIGCHGSYGDLAELTASVDPNPHASHLGEIECSHCHKAHQESVLVCNQCHDYNLKVP